MLIADAGEQISQYYGHWGTGHPNVKSGNCVQAVLKVCKIGNMLMIIED